MEITAVPKLLGLDPVEQELMLGLLQIKAEPLERLAGIARLEIDDAKTALDGLLARGVALECGTKSAPCFRLAGLESGSPLRRILDSRAPERDERLELEVELIRELQALDRQNSINVISIKGGIHRPEPAPGIANYVRSLFPYMDLRLGTCCNFNCRYCLVGEEKKSARPIDDISRELEFGRECGLQRVALTGGEPMLHPGLLRIASHARSLGYERVVLVTNASLLATQSNIDRLIDAGVNAIGFSFDVSDREVSNWLWRRDAFDLVLRGIENLMARSELILASVCVVNSENYRRLPELVRFLGNHAKGHRGLFLSTLDFIMPEENAWKNRRVLVPRLSAVAPFVREAIRLGCENGLALAYRGIPACIAGSDYLEFDLNRFMHIFQVHASGAEVTFNRAALDLFCLKPPSCRRCRHFRQCPGVFRAYAHMYGVDELVPVMRENQ